MYRETISKGKAEGYFTIPDLAGLTGIRSPNTIRRAIQGLVAKLSIVRAQQNQGSHFGSYYKVYGPKEILAARRKSGITIDLKTKRILPTEESPSGSLSPSLSNSASTVDSRSNIDRRQAQNLTVKPPHDYINHVNTPGLPKPSSVPTGPDDETRARREAVRKLFAQLSNGGNWKDERDGLTLNEISHIPLWHVIMGLCYSVGRSPEHKMSSLAYAVPAIMEHYRDMGIFPDHEMIEIAYRTMRKTLLCIQTGKWTVSEWEQ